MKKLTQKILLFLFDWLKIKTITVHDKYYDYMMDYDDYMDPPTLVDITYSERLGIILKKKLSEKMWYGTEESSLEDVLNFYKSCRINEWGGLDEYKKFSIY